MARPELGVKRICPTTGKKFYDMNRDPIVSPYTGEVLQRVIFEPTRRGAAAAAAKVVPQVNEEDAELEVPDAELVSLEEADEEEASPAKAATVDDEVDVEDAADDDDTFLAEDEDEDDGDVSDLIGDAADDEDDQ